MAAGQSAAEMRAIALLKVENNYKTNASFKETLDWIFFSIDKASNAGWTQGIYTHWGCACSTGKTGYPWNQLTNHQNLFDACTPFVPHIGTWLKHNGYTFSIRMHDTKVSEFTITW